MSQMFGDLWAIGATRLPVGVGFPPGATTQITYNNAGVYGASDGLRITEDASTTYIEVGNGTSRAGYINLYDDGSAGQSGMQIFNSSFTLGVNFPVLTGNHTINFPDASGTVVLNESGNVLLVSSRLKINTAGYGISIKEGTDAVMGVSTLSGGTVTVATGAATATGRIFLTVQSLGTVAVPKAVGVTARVADTSFTITSADATDTSVVAWHIIEPA